MIRKILKRLQHKYIIPWLSKSRKGSSFYYFYYPFFGREHRAVLAGKLMYEKDLQNKAGNEFLLRRNTHRLEKGLIMKERKEIFAKDYILETVENFISCLSNATEIQKESLDWANDVLKSYFSVVGKDEKIDRARDLFFSTKPYKSAGNQIPYQRKAFSGIEYEEFLKLSQQRRSVRWYDQKPVPREITEKALKIALNSPSACNRQPFKFYIFDEPELAKKIGSIPMGTKGFAQNFPAVAVIVGQLRAYPFERDRHVIYIDGALAAMSFMYALETLGLASCPINWPDVEPLEKEMEKELQLEKDQRPIMLISFGYPDKSGQIPYSAKMPLRRAVVFNKINDDL